MANQIQHDAGIEAAAARSHRQTVGGGESHRGCNAAPAGERAHAGAVAQMQHDGFARSTRASISGSTDAMYSYDRPKAVADHSTFGNPLRQRERLCDRRLAAVKRGIEAGHLWNLWQPLEQCTDRYQVVRLMQRRKRYVLLQRCDNLRVDAHGFRIGEPAVHYPMAHADQSCSARRSRRKATM